VALASLWSENFVRLPRVAVLRISKTCAPNLIEAYALVLSVTSRWRVCVRFPCTFSEERTKSPQLLQHGIVRDQFQLWVCVCVCMYAVTAERRRPLPNLATLRSPGNFGKSARPWSDCWTVTYSLRTRALALSPQPAHCEEPHMQLVALWIERQYSATEITNIISVLTSHVLLCQHYGYFIFLYS
jgi:hypothetical protein